jgi:hypothetical protein
MNDCNSCFCTDTGEKKNSNLTETMKKISKLTGFAACTLKGCLGNMEKRTRQSSRSTDSQLRVISANEFNKPDFECQPGEHFKVDCNNCKCTADGKHARCSKKRCLQDEEAEA